MKNTLFCFLFLLSTILIYGQDSVAVENERERITNFHSDILVYKNGDIRVTENITIYTKNEEIKRGIVRVLPYYHREKSGKRTTLRLKYLDIQRNGKPEIHSKTIVGIGNNTNQELYIGDKDVILDHGLHTYSITYELEKQIDHYDNFDELYWNVTGNDWAFDIDSASVSIILPNEVKAIEASCYTGVFGSKEQDCEVVIASDSITTLKTLSSLKSGSGFTVAVLFPRDIIKRPPPLTGFMLWWTTYTQQIIAILAISIVTLYYFLTWFKVGRASLKLSIIPTYKPPRNLSPSVMRFLFKRKQDNKLLTAAIISMAVKGTLKIEYNMGVYTLIATNTNRSKLSIEEDAIDDILFSQANRIELTDKNTPKLRLINKLLLKSIKSQWNIKSIFRNNYAYIFLGLFMTICMVLTYFTVTCFDYGEIGYAAIFLLGLGVLLILLTFTKYNIFGFYTLLMGGGLCALSINTSDYILFNNITSYAFVATLFIEYIVYTYLIKAPTAEGLKIETELKGFKLYLKTAEEHRLEILTPPDHTPELFEALLPYALALDVENKWSNKFNEKLQSLNYQPQWYSGDRPFTSIGSSGSSFASSLSSSVSSASYSSSRGGSGGGGSGSSGGGRGGGGGRGW